MSSDNCASFSQIESCAERNRYQHGTFEVNGEFLLFMVIVLPDALRRREKLPNTCKVSIESF